MENDELGVILEDDVKDIELRINVILESLKKVIVELRKNVPENLSNKDLIKNEHFKMWFLANNILNASVNNKKNDPLNIMLYYLFKECDGNILKVISQFDVDLENKTELLILETENE